MTRFAAALVIYLCLIIPTFAGSSKENNADNLQIFQERILQFEQIMERYFRQDPAATGQKAYKSMVDRYNAMVRATNDGHTRRKSDIDKRRKALNEIEMQIEKYDEQLSLNAEWNDKQAVKTYNQMLDRRNAVVKRYNRQLKKLEDEIQQFNTWGAQTNRKIDAEKMQLDSRKTVIEQGITVYNDWLRSKKDEQFWADLNQTFLLLHRKRWAADKKPMLATLIQKIRSLRKELGAYAIKQAKALSNGLVIIPGIMSGKEECHFIVDTGASQVSLNEEMVAVLGLKKHLGGETELRLAAGKTARGQKIVFPSVSVLGMEERDVSGIVIPERRVGIDGLLGRSFLKRFVVCFDYEPEPGIQLIPKNQ